MLPPPQRVARALTLAFCALALVGLAAVLWVYAELPRSARHRVKHVLAEPIARALHAEAEPAPLGPSLPADARTHRDDLRALVQTAHPSAQVEVLDFENPDLRVGQVEFIWQDLRRPELDALVAAAHARGIRVMLDVVLNHVDVTSRVRAEHPERFSDAPCICGAAACPWSTHIESCWFTPYLAVSVDARTIVPREHVKAGDGDEC